MARVEASRAGVSLSDFIAAAVSAYAAQRDDRLRTQQQAVAAAMKAYAECMGLGQAVKPPRPSRAEVRKAREEAERKAKEEAAARKAAEEAEMHAKVQEWARKTKELMAAEAARKAQEARA